MAINRTSSAKERAPAPTSKGKNAGKSAKVSKEKVEQKGAKAAHASETARANATSSAPPKNAYVGKEVDNPKMQAALNAWPEKAKLSGQEVVHQLEGKNGMNVWVITPPEWNDPEDVAGRMIAKGEPEPGKMVRQQLKFFDDGQVRNMTKTSTGPSSSEEVRWSNPSEDWRHPPSDSAYWSQSFTLQNERAKQLEEHAAKQPSEWDRIYRVGKSIFFPDWGSTYLKGH